MPLIPRTRSIALKILGISILVMFLAVIALGAIFYPHSILIELSGLEHSALSPFYAIIAVLGLAFYLDYHLIAAQGVGFVGTILGLPEAILNGISSAITGFFGWLSHFFSNLFVLPLYSYVV